MKAILTLELPNTCAGCPCVSLDEFEKPYCNVKGMAMKDIKATWMNTRHSECPLIAINPEKTWYAYKEGDLIPFETVKASMRSQMLEYNKAAQRNADKISEARGVARELFEALKKSALIGNLNVTIKNGRDLNKAIELYPWLDESEDE